ncbi:hypothetical protein Ae168Ps1_6304 [Pseudonocardia sp. Ae168_Ps1]|nr:hypothetical protein Ae150APs1_6162c [Pseudonocardia sp. Ae150A_Ps1]OLL70338.1 hypothetical protein Ae168Ps1_6304 [Pseudonocardia sp. Ae168_Ps1]OLL89051.1 hypothetical protein Ae356Ps1_6260c [Pseudonocardia sp. Ae356_Ps1]
MVQPGRASWLLSWAKISRAQGCVHGDGVRRRCW